MRFSKKNSRFDVLKRDLYKRLSEIETVVKGKLQKEVTALIDKTYLLKPTESAKAIELMEEISKYSIELKKELINPVDLIIHNYVQKIDLLLNQLQFESEG